MRKKRKSHHVTNTYVPRAIKKCHVAAFWARSEKSIFWNVPKAPQDATLFRNSPKATTLIIRREGYTFTDDLL